MDSSISGLRVVFNKIIRRREGKNSKKRIHYKVLADVSTEAGNRSQAYWFIASKSFLRQRDKMTGKTSLKVACSASQRAQIRKLVKGFDPSQRAEHATA
jgi:hypothetical protein